MTDKNIIVVENEEIKEGTTQTVKKVKLDRHIKPLDRINLIKKLQEKEN